MVPRVLSTETYGEMADPGSTGGNETVFEIIRETREGSSILSRYAVNLQTNVRSISGYL